MKNSLFDLGTFIILIYWLYGIRSVLEDIRDELRKRHSPSTPKEGSQP